MAPSTQPQQTGEHRVRDSWGLLALAAGALVLVVVALVAIPLAGRRPPELAPASTPEGVVQRYFDAIYRGDYAAAYAMHTAATREELSLAEFQERLRYQRESEMRVEAVTIHDGTATVAVRVTQFSPGGLFGGSEWSAEYDLLLERAGDGWQIMGMPL